MSSRPAYGRHFPLNAATLNATLTQSLVLWVFNRRKKSNLLADIDPVVVQPLQRTTAALSGA
jgi:hypothetical protein